MTTTLFSLIPVIFLIAMGFTLRPKNLIDLACW
ncbi:AEC family transporter, partial [Klebsiella pneumoniae]|nr:AEC family transporter [Klebsiella pneumoniae]